MWNKSVCTPCAWVKAQLENGAIMQRLYKLMNPKHSMRADPLRFILSATCILFGEDSSRIDP
jgi:hypothetical protein